MGIFIILFPLIILLIIIWVSYYTSGSVYRSLVKKENKNARAFQVLTFLLMFTALIALIFFFVITNLTFQR